mgnify:FL=1
MIKSGFFLFCNQLRGKTPFLKEFFPSEKKDVYFTPN